MSLKLPEVLEEALAAAAARRGVTKSALLRDALRSYLGLGAGGSDARDADEVREPLAAYAEPELPPKDSFLDLAGHLAGCVEGPPDLSSNPEHLRGLGR
ncbi:MAG TPA: ribbon-helix-helix protein, CopG family [Thermoanaerobaculia bacterium]|nr:ribbon-helix-helix protein, CopG family [Thermoanaerobaculia bacterium]